MTISESIRHHRKRLDLTQSELAKRLGVSVQAISKWETNVGLPDITMVPPLAQALGTTTDELLQFGQRRKAREQMWCERLQSSRDDPKEMLEAAMSALEEFPWDWQFRYRAAVCCLRIADALPDSPERRDTLCRGEAHARLAVEMSPDNRSALWIREEIRERLESDAPSPAAAP